MTNNLDIYSDFLRRPGLESCIGIWIFFADRDYLAYCDQGSPYYLYLIYFWNQGDISVRKLKEKYLSLLRK